MAGKSVAEKARVNRSSTFAMPFVVVAAVVASGCSTEQSAHPGGTVARDSAGVSIVEARTPALAPHEAWWIEPTPITSIGVVAGEEPYLLSFVLTARRLADGRILVLDEDPSRRIRVFGSDGRHAEFWGGAGGGPGEFIGDPAALFEAPDGGFVVPEFTARRVHYFAWDGRFGYRADLRYQREVDPRDRVAASSCCTFRAVLQDGTWLVSYPEEALIAGTGLRRGTSVIVRYSPEGQSLDHFVTYPGGSWRPGGALDARPLVPVPLTGNLDVAAYGSEVFIGNGSEYIVDVYDLAGRHVRSLRLEKEPPPFSDDLRSTYIETRIGGIRRLRGEEEAERRAAEIVRHLPERLPAYSRIIPDATGHLWLLSSSVPGADHLPATAVILTAAGEFLGEITLPPDLRITQIGDDWLLGVASDELGVNRVVLHRLNKPNP